MYDLTRYISGYIAGVVASATHEKTRKYLASPVSSAKNDIPKRLDNLALVPVAWPE